MAHHSTRGHWLDTSTGTVYETTLRQAVFAVGGNQAGYYRCWLASQKRRPWPEDVPIRPASRSDIEAAKRTTVYEVEMVLLVANAYALENTILQAGGWLRRVSWQDLPRKLRMPSYKRCTWLISGFNGYDWLRQMASVTHGHVHELDEGQYKVLFRGEGQAAVASGQPDGV